MVNQNKGNDARNNEHHQTFKQFPRKVDDKPVMQGIERLDQKIGKGALADLIADLPADIGQHHTVDHELKNVIGDEVREFIVPHLLIPEINGVPEVQQYGDMQQVAEN